MISGLLVPTLCMWEKGFEFLIKTLRLANIGMMASGEWELLLDPPV